MYGICQNRFGARRAYDFRCNDRFAEQQRDVTFCPVGIQANYLQADAREMRTSNGKPSTSDPAAIERKVRADLYWQSLFMEAMSLGSNELWIYYDNYRFESEDEAIGRIARVLMADAPPSIEVFHIVAMQHGEPQQQVTVVRGALERATSAEGATMSVGQGITLNTPPLDNPAVDRAEPGLYPSFAWSLDPKLTEHLFDPTDPLQFMIYADATALVQLSPNWLIKLNLPATFGTIIRLIARPAVCCRMFAPIFSNT